jgi:hypothetical protein
MGPQTSATRVMPYEVLSAGARWLQRAGVTSPSFCTALSERVYGGTLTYLTEMGKGTTFLLRLPLRTTGVNEEVLAG